MWFCNFIVFLSFSLLWVLRRLIKKKKKKKQLELEEKGFKNSEQLQWCWHFWIYLPLRVFLWWGNISKTKIFKGKKRWCSDVYWERRCNPILNCFFRFALFRLPPLNSVEGSEYYYFVLLYTSSGLYFRFGFVPVTVLHFRNTPLNSLQTGWHLQCH